MRLPEPRRGSPLPAIIGVGNAVLLCFSLAAALVLGSFRNAEETEVRYRQETIIDACGDVLDLTAKPRMEVIPYSRPFPGTRTYLGRRRDGGTAVVRYDIGGLFETFRDADCNVPGPPAP